MPHIPPSADLDNTTRLQTRAVALRQAKRRRPGWLATPVLISTLLAAAAAAQVALGPLLSSPALTGSQDTQTPTGSGPARSASPIAPSPDSQTQGTTSTASGLQISIALPASQIIAILQQKPEVVVELKTLLSDQMQQQGAQVQPDDITDEMLYNQISTNASLRASITSFLRARGYVSDDDLQSLASSVEDPDAAASLTSARSSGMLSTDTGALTRSTSLGSAADNSLALPSSTSRAATTPTRRDQPTTSSTDEPKVLRSPAPFNLQSMRDLYTQIPEPSSQLKRFGSDVFLNRDTFSMSRGGAARDTPIDVPLGPDYIVGPGDSLTVTLWGGTTQNLTRVVDRDGHILLPEAGSIAVSGLPLSRVQTLIEGALRQQYRNAQIAVTVSQLRSVRVYVVGDVQRPGGFDISSLATPLSALLAAGGPTSVGSLRTLRHFRGKTLVEEVDLYDFLLNGLRAESARFESGDTLLVPPAGPQIAVFGAVRRPAIYELKIGELKTGDPKPADSSLASVIEDAGGFTPSASLSHITVERIDANHQRETITVDLGATKNPQADQAALTNFTVKDGDRIRIAPILPYSERAIYLEGHVVRPGRQPYTEGMRLSDALRSYQDMLPEPAAHGEIVRLVPPDLHAETIAFDVPEVLIGNTNIPLRPFDTIRILGRYEADPPKVTINGEVLRPATFPLSKGMTAAQLVRMAGGFKTDALTDNADLTSYTIADGNRVVGNVSSIRIGAALSGADPAADVPLKPGDILTIHQITGWTDIGQSVTIDGQVAFPGMYGFQEGERLSSVLRRAGGFRDTAYPAGAILLRDQVRELEQKSREELIRQIETSSAAARLSPNISSSDSGQTLQLIQAQQDQVLARLKAQPPVGRLVVHLSADINSWANTPADLELRRGDTLTIPKRPGFVLITGQVYNVTALTFSPNQTASWYLSHAGGTNTIANRKEIFVIRANGSVIGRHSGGGGWFSGDVLSTKLDPGDVIVVPQKILGASLFWKNLLTAAQLAASVAVTVAVATL